MDLPMNSTSTDHLSPEAQSILAAILEADVFKWIQSQMAKEAASRAGRDAAVKWDGGRDTGQSTWKRTQNSFNPPPAAASALLTNLRQGSPPINSTGRPLRPRAGNVSGVDADRARSAAMGQVQMSARPQPIRLMDADGNADEDVASEALSACRQGRQMTQLGAYGRPGRMARYAGGTTYDNSVGRALDTVRRSLPPGSADVLDQLADALGQLSLPNFSTRSRSYDQ